MSDNAAQVSERLNEIYGAFNKASRAASAAQDDYLRYVRTLTPTGDEVEDEKIMEDVNERLYDFGMETYRSFDLSNAADFEAWEPSTC